MENNKEELNILDLVAIFLKGKKIIASVTALTAIFVIIYSLTLPNLYESSALLNPIKSDNSSYGAFENFSGLASLAGINLKDLGGEANSEMALEKVVSLSFFETNIVPNIFLPELMALKSWNYDSNSLIYDANIYDKSSETWADNSEKPSAQKSFKVFQKKHLRIREENNGFVSIKIKHKSPYIAKAWVELIVEEINAFYREKDKSQAEKAITYLNKQLMKTSLSEIRKALAELLQIEIQKTTLIEAKEAYVFDYIDSPVVMEQKSEPSRSLIILLGTFLGIVLGYIIVLFKHFSTTRKYV